ncbi:ALF repeat-containing protein [Kitasatospora sp. NPDC058170]|uniref:ALF repeat-containing protein n=1 Tax=Kitasatospora sp. NPDC058170 TaxID=3346364 RepID=UPI0036D95D12
MKFPKVAAVLAAAALAPTVLFPSTASAAEQPKPVGVSGPGTASTAAADHDATQEERDRAEIRRILADRTTGPGVRGAAEKALAGTAADLRHFLEVELDKQRQDDDRVEVSKLLASGGPAVRKAAQAALDGTYQDILAFLKEGRYKARAEDDDRAEVQRIIDDKETGYAVRDAARKVVNGTAAELRHFLDVGLDEARVSDYRLRTAQIAGVGGRAVRDAADRALRTNTREALLAFLNEGQYTARAEDDRVEILALLSDKETGPRVQEAARKALDGTPADLRRFFETELGPLRESDDRVKVSQLLETGGPAVRKAAQAALDGTYQNVLAFLKDGQFKARAEDEANAAGTAKPAQPVQLPDRGGEQPSSQAGPTGQTVQAARPVQPVQAAEVATGTAKPTTAAASAQAPAVATAAPASERLATTGTDEGLDWKAAAGATAIVAGAGLLVVSRRRSTKR